MENKTIVITIVLFSLIAILIGTLTFGDELLEEKLVYVSSTEYIATDEGQTIVRLTDFKGTPLIATCKDTILYPNKTSFVTDASMTSDGQGNYYHTFIVPPQDGVYTTTVNCTIAGRSITNSKTFHVSLLSSSIQQRFDALQINITSNHLKTIQAINQTKTNLTIQIIQTQTQIEETKNNLSTQITTFSSSVENNFTTIFNLINSFNNSESQQHDNIFNLLSLINQTTATTYSELQTFRSETSNNFNIINQTVTDIKDDTILINDKIDNITIQVNNTYHDLSNEIEILTNFTQQNFDITYDNLTTILNLIKDLNVTMNNGFDDIITIFFDFNQTINYKLDILNSTTILTEYEARLILEYLNITLQELNIFPQGNDCWIGGQFHLYANVQNQFGVTQTPTTVTCNVTTANWGGAFPMIWDTSSNRFKYTHECDAAGSISWTIECDYI